MARMGYRKIPNLHGDDPITQALRELERMAREAFRAAMMMPLEFDAVVHQADMTVLATEARDIMTGEFVSMPAPLPERIVPVSREEAWAAWRDLFDELGGRWP